MWASSPSLKWAMNTLQREKTIVEDARIFVLHRLARLLPEKFVQKIGVSAIGRP